MEKQEMLDDLNNQSEKLKEELIKLEQDFNQKKEHYIRIQGALESLNVLDQKTQST